VSFHYLLQALAFKKEIEQRRADNESPRNSERRRARRWSSQEVAWVSWVGLTAGERADLIDISSCGALVRTPDRPQLASMKNRGPDSRPQPGLILHLTSGDEVRAAGQVVRYHVRLIANGPVLYEVALQFDESVDLYLPTAPLLALETGGPDMSALAVEVPPERPSRPLSEVFNRW
jgi:hypothetical protein